MRLAFVAPAGVTILVNLIVMVKVVRIVVKVSAAAMTVRKKDKIHAVK